MITAQELQSLIDAQPAFAPTGRALAFLIVTIISLILTTFCVGLRVWFRFWKMRRSRIWGWDDLFAFLGQCGFMGVCAFGIIMPHYGVGTRDESLNAFYKLRTIYYEVWFNCFLVAGLCFAKTSIGVAILRISIHKKYDYMIYAILAVSNLAFVALFIWLLSSCTPVAARWNPLLGTCHTEGLLPMVYMTTTVAFVTDAGCAIIPVMILRELLLPRKTKYALMGVLATGGVTVVIAVARFPFIKYLDTGSSRVNALYNIAWFDILAVLELALGLIAGSLPSLGKMFHLYDKQTTNRGLSGRTPVGQGNTVGGTNKRISKQLSSRHHQAAGSELVLVPKGVRRASEPRVSGATYVDEELQIGRKSGIVQQTSFSVSKTVKGGEAEGHYWKVEAA